MWREKIIEAKKAKNITTKMMSERTPSHIPVETIARILTAKTEFPRIDTVLELGAAVGLSPWELFAETTSLVGDRSHSAMQAKIDALIAENCELKDKVNTLRDKIDSLKDEIIATHNYYTKLKQNN